MQMPIQRDCRRHNTDLHLFVQRNDRNHHTSPQLRHDIEEAEAPNPQNRDRTKETRAERRQEPIGERGGMDGVAQRIQHERKGPEKGYERQNHGVEQGLLREHVRQLGVQQHEPYRHRQVHPRLQERDNLGAAPLGGHHQHVLGVPENGIIEENTEEHNPQRNYLLQRRYIDAQELGLLIPLRLDKSSSVGRNRGAGSKNRSFPRFPQKPGVKEQPFGVPEGCRRGNRRGSRPGAEGMEDGGGGLGPEGRRGEPGGGGGETTAKGVEGGEVEAPCGDDSLHVSRARNFCKDEAGRCRRGEKIWKGYGGKGKGGDLYRGIGEIDEEETSR
ncbi:hypothetical protein BHM03_00056025 [Ensete ventricosum]|uniref:Uncharacterized protein n=1 Tax=Ensete ventricosum TaxID=4639 RepID=A0A445MMA1_ENSVE|nr:hypothetical protein BHM03_00056025 [Ensete ventricosum]